jgi:outer membrane murein-binding lipoprotein Lpp
MDFQRILEDSRKFGETSIKDDLSGAISMSRTFLNLPTKTSEPVMTLIFEFAQPAAAKDDPSLKRNPYYLFHANPVLKSLAKGDTSASVGISLWKFPVNMYCDLSQLSAWVNRAGSIKVFEIEPFEQLHTLVINTVGFLKMVLSSKKLQEELLLTLATFAHQLSLWNCVVVQKPDYQQLLLAHRQGRSLADKARAEYDQRVRALQSQLEAAKKENAEQKKEYEQRCEELQSTVRTLEAGKNDLALAVYQAREEVRLVREDEVCAKECLKETKRQLSYQEKIARSDAKIARAAYHRVVKRLERAKERLIRINANSADFLNTPTAMVVEQCSMEEDDDVN